MLDVVTTTGDIHRSKPSIFDRREWRALTPVCLADGSAAARFLCDADGEGIGVARTDARGVNSIDRQLEALAALHSRGRRLREIIVANALSGFRRFHERPDLLAVEAAVSAIPRWVRFVAFTEIDRISRSMDGALLFAEFLHENDVELVLVDHGDKAIDVVGSPEFRLLASLAIEERSAMVARMRVAKLHKRPQAR
jgi:DNA invertase Pin-like site-specific DNA recombinase